MGRVDQSAAPVRIAIAKPACAPQTRYREQRTRQCEPYGRHSIALHDEIVRLRAKARGMAIDSDAQTRSVTAMPQIDATTA